MCGIVGVVHRDPSRPVPPELISRMCDAIRHRGPDDEGIYTGENAGLGMRRLSIIDLSGGHQPIYNEDGSKLIVFNGEIYNYRDLRTRLLSSGHTLRTASDTESILHLYEDLGPRCVEPLRGMFAFAVWDKDRRSLLLARDRFGIKPLYYVVAPWGLAFSSELKALHAVGMTGGELDWEALDMYFQIGYIPAPASPFVQVRKLMPAHTLEWESDGTIRIRQYWDLPREQTAPPAQVAERVLDWFDQSVKAHMIADVPVAAFLSGGLDSSAVVASMAQRGEKTHAFTARYTGSSAEAADESGLAALLARRYGAELEIVEVNPGLNGLLEPIVHALDEPQADESSVPSWLISKAVAAKYKVALVGTGGDELFAGYRRHLGLLAGELYHKVPGSLRRGLSRLAAMIPEPRDSSLGRDRIKRFLRTSSGEPPSRYLGYLSRLPAELRPTLYSAATRSKANTEPASRHFAEIYAEGGSPHGLKAALYLDYKTYLPDDILMLSDRISMAHSLEVRVPFVDHELVEMIFPLPDSLKVGLGKPKPLLRKAMQSRLPQEHFNAPKRGFVGPTAAWIRGELRPVIEDELSASRLTRLGYFSPAAIQGLMGDHFEGRQNREGILWALLCFSTWHRLYLEGAAIPHYAPA